MDDSFEIFVYGGDDEMEQQSSSSLPPVGEIDLEVLSAYEDALDESDTELQKLCEDAARHLTRERPRVQGIFVSPVVKRTSSKQHKRSSSSEHSSIEKVSEGFRSRRPTAGREGRPSRSRRSGSDEGSGEEWRIMNYAEVAHYPVLVQINQQLQLLSRQLYEIESTNSLQLKIISNLIGKLIKSRRRPWFSLGKLIRFLPIALCIFFWPFVARSLYYWIARKRQSITFLRYL